jgi:16S rRNA (cytosine1402-N4)-methyltransferase
MTEHGHTPVLEEEVMRLLAPAPGAVAVDCTTGRGGHALRLARAVGREGRVVGFDLDAENLDAARARIEPTGTPFTAFHESFVRAPRRLRELGLRADVVLADLGVASTQLDDPARGLSFRADGPLDMRLDRTARIPTAADLVSTLDEDELARVIREYGEEPLARKIARNLVRSRSAQPIETTAQLADLVVEAYGARAHRARMHPSTRTFMALRIAVNGELAALEMLLDSIRRDAVRGTEGTEDAWLEDGARVAIISFHSLEDRQVKRSFADLERRGFATRLTRRPETAGEEEIERNTRARSARLRVIRLGSAPARHGDEGS